MEAGDIVFFKGSSFISKIISTLTGSPYSHVALVIGENEIIEADRFIKVRTRQLDKEEIVFLKKVGMYLTDSQKESLVAEARLFLNKGYDYKSILKWFVRLVFRLDISLVDNANHLICSELIDRSYANIGIDLVPEREDGDVTPFHLLTAKVDKIIKGDI